MGERVNKIRFVGSINREVRFGKSQYVYQAFGKKGNSREGEEKESVLRFLLNQIRVRLIIL